MEKAKMIKNGNVNLTSIKVDDNIVCDCLHPGCNYCGQVFRPDNPDTIFKQETMKKYVVMFIFTPDYEDVWLIKKEKPEWQKGCLNGIGGKIEEGEDAYSAAHRELEEEAGIKQGTVNLLNVGVMDGTNNDGNPFLVEVFAGMTNENLISQEKEQIGLYDIGELKLYKYIENVPALVELCKYFMTGESNFNSFKLNY